MNRHERRRATKLGRNSFVENYVRHLPEVSGDAPYERGRVYHTVYAHDDWCAIHGKDNGGLADCNCNPTVRRFVQPQRN